MKLMRFILPIAVVSVGFLATTIPATGTMELAKKRKDILQNLPCQCQEHQRVPRLECSRDLL